MRAHKRLLLLGMVLLLCVLGWTGCNRAPGRAEDIAWLRNDLPRLHKNLFALLPREQYEQALGDLALRADKLGREEYIVALAQIVAALGDAHTTMGLGNRQAYGFGSLPVQLFWFADGVHVIRASKALEHTLGARLVSVEGIPVEEVLERTARLVARENDSIVRQTVPALLTCPEILFGLGITAKKDQAVMTLVKAGQEFTIVLERQESSGAMVDSFTVAGIEPPLWWASTEVLWFRHLTAEKALYIQYNSCKGDLSGQTAEIIRLLNSQPVEKIIFDVRRNGGGNSAVATDLLRKLSDRPEAKKPGSLFVIIGRATFSSAVINTVNLQQWGGAILAGEPSGGKPNHFGEVQTATLPFSGFPVSYSVKYFTLVSGDPPSLMPDLEVQLFSDDFFAGGDPVLDAVLRFKPDR